LNNKFEKEDIAAVPAVARFERAHIFSLEKRENKNYK
jgi:hypothetical protein